MAHILWIDVEDLLWYADKRSRPTGIQRLSFQIFCELQAEHGNSGLIQFVRHDSAHESFRCVEWEEIAATFTRLTESRPENAALAQGEKSLPSPPRRLFRALMNRVTEPIRVPALDALAAQRDAFRAWMRLAIAIVRQTSQLARHLAKSASPSARRHRAAMYKRFDTTASPGDVLLVLGGPWVYPDYAALIDRHRAQRGIRLALLVYDLIPLRRPEWFQTGLAPVFVRWFNAILPMCDHLFAISRATATDVEAYARQAGIALSSSVVPIPIGTTLGSAGSASVGRLSARLPIPGSYALIVSTIEARKNHLLLFRIWRRLLEEMPLNRVPTLVFAGHIGWMVDDLLRQIANTQNLNGKLAIIEDPSDAELAALYAGCLFTLFPSYYEGWGLPVTESLAFGKPCFISNRTSLPEAGSGLARCFDPDDLPAAYEKIRSVLEDRGDLMLWEERVRREFRPVPWSATVAALLAQLRHPLARAPHVDALTDGPAA